MPTTRHFSSSLAWRAALVQEVESGLAQAAHQGRTPVLALSGGHTPRAYLPALVRGQTRVPWARVLVMLCDDRRVPSSHPASNHGLIARAFGLLRRDRRPAVMPLVRLTPGQALPRPDVALLGMGLDGHTASLMPEGPGLDPADRCPVASLRRPQDPYGRITLSLATLAAVPRLIVCCQGAEKAALWERASAAVGPPAKDQGPPSPPPQAPESALPITRLLRAARGSVTALVLF